MRPATPGQRFEAYRAQVRAEQEAGKINVVQEQEKLRDRYWQIWQGADSAGHFAYSIALMQCAGE
jgi:chemotaxis methyl-accepting protein methylase